MRSSLGISLGTANLIAVADGRPTARPSVVTTTSGLTVTGFVERIGDPVPLVLADHSVHRAEALAAILVDFENAHPLPRFKVTAGNPDAALHVRD